MAFLKCLYTYDWGTSGWYCVMMRYFVYFIIVISYIA